MKRFLMLVGVAVVAAAMYVAASPAGQQSKGPTLAQFNALKKQVATMNKNLKNTKLEADAALGVLVDCYMTVGNNSANTNGLGVSRLGSNSNGFLFGTSGVNSPTTALDVATSSPTYYLAEVTPACVQGQLMRHRALHKALVQHLAQRSH